MTAVETITLTINEEYQNLYPPLTKEEYNDLKESIKNNGQWEPIIVSARTGPLVIIEGYHRYKVCLEQGIDPKYRIEFFKDESEEINCILECNDKRRHLDSWQRAKVHLRGKEFLKRVAEKNKLANLKQNQNQNQNQVPSDNYLTVDDNDGNGNSYQTKKSLGRVNKEIGKAAGLSHETIRKVDILQKHAPQPILDDLDNKKLTINQGWNQYQKHEKKQKLRAEASNLPRLPDGVKLIHSDFRQIGEQEVPSNSIPLIFVDPPYKKKDLPLYKGLGRFATKVLQDGGSLVTYLEEGYIDIVIEYLRESGLKSWTPIVVKLAGQHPTKDFRSIFGYCKLLLWFVKGDKLRKGIPTSYMPNYVESTVPEKILHEKGWEQSPTEAEHVIKYLTFPNETVLDCMCGTGTTGIAALKLGRQFIGIDIDENECKNADINIRRYCERSSST